MKKQLFVLCLVAFVTGCGRAAFHQRTVRDGSEVISSSTYQRDRYGDEDSKSDCDVSSGYGCVAGSVMGGDSLIDPPQLIFQPVPMVTYGERLEETFQGSAVVPVPSGDGTVSDVYAKHSEQLRAIRKVLVQHDALLNAKKSDK
jgi:hypothetical protein